MNIQELYPEIIKDNCHIIKQEPYNGFQKVTIEQNGEAPQYGTFSSYLEIPKIKLAEVKRGEYVKACHFLTNFSTPTFTNKYNAKTSSYGLDKQYIFFTEVYFKDNLAQIVYPTQISYIVNSLSYKTINNIDYIQSIVYDKLILKEGGLDNSKYFVFSALVTYYNKNTGELEESLTQRREEVAYLLSRGDYYDTGIYQKDKTVVNNVDDYYTDNFRLSNAFSSYYEFKDSKEVYEYFLDQRQSPTKYQYIYLNSEILI